MLFIKKEEEIMRDETTKEIGKRSLRESIKYTTAGMYTGLIVAILTGQKFTNIWWLVGVMYILGLVTIWFIVFLVNLGEKKD